MVKDRRFLKLLQLSARLRPWTISGRVMNGFALPHGPLPYLSSVPRQSAVKAILALALGLTATIPSALEEQEEALSRCGPCCVQPV